MDALPRNMIRLLVSLVLLCVAAGPALALTARDLSARFTIDGFTADFEADERVFRFNEQFGEPEEGLNDSKWGEYNDINQIRITWDQTFLYVAGEGRIWDNNMIIFLDVVPGRGILRPDTLNSWRRNFAFDTTGLSRGDGFAPEVFLATWDRNTSPRLLIGEANDPYRVLDREVSSGLFNAAATFDQSNPGRSMEFAIPWSTIFVNAGGLRDTTVLQGGIPTTYSRFAPGTRLKVVAVITAGPDGTGGPDSAPDNTQGHVNDSGTRVFLDNWAIVELDRQDDSGLGAGGPDGIADWNVSPESRVSFRFRPPIPESVAQGLRFRLQDVELDRAVIRPDFGDRVRFRMKLDPAPDLTNAFHQVTQKNFRADVYDLRGRLVRSLFPLTSRRVLETENPAVDWWDGRDAFGRPVEPGVYVLRVELDGQSRVNRSVVVVR